MPVAPCRQLAELAKSCRTTCSATCAVARDTCGDQAHDAEPAAGTRLVEQFLPRAVFLCLPTAAQVVSPQGNKPVMGVVQASFGVWNLGDGGDELGLEATSSREHSAN